MPGEGQSIENLQIEIGTESSSAYQGLEKLISVLKRIDNLGNKSTGLSRLRTQLKSLGKISLAPLSKELKSIQRSLSDIAKLRGIFQSVTGAAGAPVANVPVTTPTASTETASAVNNVTQPLRDATAEFRNVASAQGDLAAKTKQTNGALANCTKGLHDVRPAAQTGSKALNKFASSLKRIMMYRMIRAILRQITEAIKEGLQNVAQYSSEVNYTLSQLSTLSLQLKNSLGAMLAPLIKILTPLLIGLGDAAIYLMNGLNALFSLLTGKSSYIKAKAFWKDYAEGIEQAKKALAGFDEINKLGEKTNPADMFEEVETGLGDLSAAFTAIGTIAATVTVALAAFGKIKWGTAIAALKNIGGWLLIAVGLCETISGFISIWNDGASWENLLQSLAGAGALTAGLVIIFGEVAGGIGAAISAVGLLVVGIKDLVSNGPSLEGFMTIVTGLGLAFVSAGLFVKGFNSSLGLTLVVIGGIIAVVASVISGFDEMSRGWQIATTVLAALIAVLATGAIAWLVYNGAMTFGVGAALAAAAIGGAAVALYGTLKLCGVFADGGFPTEGQLFIANEAGPELVGNIGHRTAVANDNQIISGIAQGVSEGMEDMDYGGDWIIQVVDSDGRVKGSQIVRAADRKNKRDGKTVVQLG